MRSKSFVRKGGFFEGSVKKYGEILAESYYMKDKKGNYKESSPNTSEILYDWFNQYAEFLTLNGEDHHFYLGLYDVGIELETFTTPDGITTERLICKPTLNSCSNFLMNREFNKYKSIILNKEKEKLHKAQIKAFRELFITTETPTH